LVKEISYGDIKEVVYVNIISHSLKEYRKISRNQVVNVVTGEIIDCKVSSTREDNQVSLRRTIKRLRDLINCNFFGDDNELFITLTYRENMTDYKRLYKDFDRFYKRLRYRFKDIEFCYISVIEPQERGAWHLHVLLKALNKDYLFIDNDSVISELWGQGFTKTQRLRGVDNVGAYLSSYLTDLIDEKGRKKKGARLYLYPSGVNIYRCSRNCRRPVERWVDYGEIDYKDHKTYEVAYGIYDDDGDRCFNMVKKEFYNLRRPKMVDDGTDAGRGGR
jgi:hypothetical protein